MIIECQACRARFKLDETRIKGKGARIRCRKCGEAIIIMKSDLPGAPAAPVVEKEVFDLRAQLQGSGTQSRPEERPVEAATEREPFPAEVAAQPPEPPAPAGEAVGAAVDEPDLRDTGSGVPEAAGTQAHEEPGPQPWAPGPVEPAGESSSSAGGWSPDLETASPGREESEPAALSGPEDEERAQEVQPEPSPQEIPERESMERETAEPEGEPAAADGDETELDDSLVRLFRHEEADTSASFGTVEEEIQAEAQSEPPPQAPSEREFPDREATESAEEPPVAADDDGSPFQRFLHEDREPEAFQPEPTDSFEPVPEGDPSLDSPLFGEDAAEPVSAPPAEEPPGSGPAQVDDAVPPQPSEELSAAPPSEVALGQPLNAEPSPGEEPESEEFLTLDTDLPEFLRKEDSGNDEDSRFDISWRLSDTPREVPGEEPTPVAARPDLPIPPAEPPRSRAEEFHEELAGLSEAGPAEEAAAPLPPPPEVAEPTPAEPEPTPAEPETRRPVRRAKREPSSRPSFMLLALLFLTLAGGGAYLAFTDVGQSNLRTVVSRLESFWLGEKGAVASYKVSNLIGYYETSDKAGKLFVIKGTVSNEGQSKKSAIRVRAELLDADHRTIADKTAYAGNVIPGLRSADRKDIEAAMSNRFGASLSNVDVAPGKSVAFMVVFFDPPDGIEEYRMEAMQGE